MWIVCGFGSMGLLIGFMMGLTKEGSVKSTIALLFAFAGGTVIAFLGKLDDKNRQLAGKMVLAISFGCILGLVVGIKVNYGRLLSPNPVDDVANFEEREKDYLRASISAISPDTIDAEKQHGQLSAEDAYNQMRDSYRKLYDAASSTVSEGSRRTH